MKLETLEAYIEAYGKDVYAFCLYLTHSRQDADDLYQDTFLKMVEIRGKLELSRNPKSYLLSVAVHIWTNRKRKTAWRQKITGPQVPIEDMAQDPPDGKGSPEEQYITREERVMVRQAVQALPEKYRLPVLLFYMEGQKLSEISRILEIPEGTVKTRLYRAKKLLERGLEVVLNEQRYGQDFKAGVVSRERTGSTA